MEVTMSFESLCPYVREVGRQQGDMWQIPRRIYDHEMLLCLSGRALLTIEGVCHELSAGRLAIIPPNTAHTLQYDQDETADLIWFHFDFTCPSDGDWIYRWYNKQESYLLCFADQLPFPEHIRPKPVFPGDFHLPSVVCFEDASEVERLFLSMEKAYLLEQHHFMLLSRITVLRILDAVLDRCGYWKPSVPIRVSNQIIHYIHTHYRERLTTQDICSCTQYQVDYAGKLFRRETGSTVIEYLNRFRIQKAQTMLLDESLTVAVIAERCGFQSVNYFSAVSKRLTGKSPREMRAYLLTMKQNSTLMQEGL